MLNEGEIEELTKDFDVTIVNKDLKRFLEFFDDSCEIELMNLKLNGKRGAEKWFHWMFSYCDDARFMFMQTALKDDTYFVEYVLKATMKNGDSLESKQACVILFKGTLIKSLRLYFDRLDFASAVANLPSKLIINGIINKSIEGLTKEHV